MLSVYQPRRIASCRTKACNRPHPPPRSAAWRWRRAHSQRLPGARRRRRRRTRAGRLGPGGLGRVSGRGEEGGGFAARAAERGSPSTLSWKCRWKHCLGSMARGEPFGGGRTRGAFARAFAPWRLGKDGPRDKPRQGTRWLSRVSSCPGAAAASSSAATPRRGEEARARRWLDGLSPDPSLQGSCVSRWPTSGPRPRTPPHPALLSPRGGREVGHRRREGCEWSVE